MHNLGAFLLQPTYPFVQLVLDLSFQGIHLVLGNPPLPLQLRVAEPRASDGLRLSVEILVRLDLNVRTSVYLHCLFFLVTLLVFINFYPLSFFLCLSLLAFVERDKRKKDSRPCLYSFADKKHKFSLDLMQILVGFAISPPPLLFFFFFWCFWEFENLFFFLLGASWDV